MAVTAARARTLALSLEGASAYPHFDRVAFRIPQRTFATLALDGSDLNLLFDLAQQAEFCELAPLAIAPVAGGWGRMGWTRCDLKQIDAATFTLALKAAHARASAPRTRKGAAQPAPASALQPAKAAKKAVKKTAKKAVKKPAKRR
jgi:hypothetical protein